MQLRGHLPKPSAAQSRARAKVRHNARAKAPHGPKPIQQENLTQAKLVDFGCAPVQQDSQAATAGMATVPADHVHTPEQSLLWGDPHVSSKDLYKSGGFRVFSHNVNGLSSRDAQVKLKLFVKTMRSKGVAVFGVQETNMNFQRQYSKLAVYQHVKRTSKLCQGAVSSAPMGYTDEYQPGGTATFVRDRWATRFLSSGSDSMGRWSWLTLAGKGTTRITFISAYQVCDGKDKESTVSRTFRVQLEEQNTARGRTKCDLRQQTITDLLHFIKKLKKDGQDIVLMMDANDTAGRQSLVDRLMINGGLVDAHGLGANASSTPPATYQRGSKKIDYVFITPRLVDAVTAASILPICDGHPSDHRALVVDFDSYELFGDTTTELVPGATRPLTSKSRRAVHAYIKEMRLHFDDNDLLDRINEMNAVPHSEWSNEWIATYDILDLLLEQGRSRSERKCLRKGSGKYPFSPQLFRAMCTHFYWVLRRRDLWSKFNNVEEIAKMAELAEIPENLQGPLKAKKLREYVSKARKALTAVQQNATALRDAMRTEDANFKATVQGCDPDSAKTQILNQEITSKEFGDAIFFKGKDKLKSTGGLSRVDVLNHYAVLREGEEVPRIPLVVKEDIEEVLLPHTMKRFTQYQETPFGHGPRQEKLGMNCDSDDFEDLLNGDYDYELDDLTPEARAWLKHLKTKDFAKGDHCIDSEISMDDWIDGWKKMKESTVSGGSHFGHYKTAAVVARLPEKDPDYFPALAHAYAIMHSLPLRHGFAPARWQTCVDAVLEKIPGKPILEKLRIIMLFQADFNFMLKVVWGRRLVKFAENHKALGSDNHGSRSGRQVQDAQVEKVLIYDHARLTRTNLITIDNDAKSCYDRILKTLAMVACVSYGLPLLAAAMHNKVHHGMQHQIRTRHGLLRPYSGSDENPLEGTGQGSGASPAIWLIYSITLLAAFREFVKGMFMSSPTDLELFLVILAILFVDDKMPGVNDADVDEPVSIEDLIEEAKSCAQSWERLLFASGGALEISKCFAYIVYWDLTDGGHRMLSLAEIPGCDVQDSVGHGPISLTYGDETDRHYHLVTENPFVGRRTLGVRTAPSGTWDDEFEFRLEQSREVALLASISKASKSATERGFRAMVYPKLEFPLTVTQFSQKQCDRILSPILNVCLPKMGFNRHMPREVVFGPLCAGGLGFHDLYIEQGIKHVQCLVGHLREPDSQTGKMLRIEMDWCQRQAGIGTHLLTNVDMDIDYIEDCWIMGLRDYLRTYGFHLEFTTVNLPKLQCENDQFLMEAFLQSEEFTATELQHLNACRMFLKVVRLSDIVSGDGKKLLKCYLQGLDHQKHHCSAGKWPRQHRPLPPKWTLWRRALRLLFSTTGSSNTLRQPLGEWFNTMTVGEWAAVAVSTPTLEVYVKQTDGSYKVHQKATLEQNSRLSYVASASDSTVLEPPLNAIPVTLKSSRGGTLYSVSMRGKQPDAVAALSRAECDTFEKFCSIQPSHVREVLKHCDKTDVSSLAVADLIEERNHIDCAPDGGMLDGIGTFGFVVADEQIQKILMGACGKVPGLKHIMSSTRTELQGIFACLTYLRLVVEYYDIPAEIIDEDFTCWVHCDSKAAISRVEGLEYETFGTMWRCRQNYDLEAAIRECLNKLSFKVSMKWVKGHADDRKESKDFTWPEFLNVEADELATLGRESDDLSESSHWPEQVVSVVGKRGRVLGRLGNELRYESTIDDLVSKYCEKYGWTEEDYDLLDHEGFQKVMLQVKGGVRRRVQLLRAGWIPVNRRVARQEADRRVDCEACGAHEIEETIDHLFQCTSRLRRELIVKELEQMKKQFKEWKTDASIINAMHSGVLAWIEGRDIPSVEELDLPDTELGRLTALAYSEQSRLGWSPFLRGFRAVSWRKAQEVAFRNLPPGRREKRDSGEAWSGWTISWFVSFFEKIWKQRNDKQFGDTPETIMAQRTKLADRGIRRLYRAGEALSEVERQPFTHSIATMLALPIASKERWILDTDRGIAARLARDKRRTTEKWSAITAFFPRLARDVPG